MLLQTDNSYIILSMVKEVESHEARNNWKLMKNSEINNIHKNKDGKLKTIWSILSFNIKRFPDGILMKYKPRTFTHGGMQQWGVKY